MENTDDVDGVSNRSLEFFGHGAGDRRGNDKHTRHHRRLHHHRDRHSNRDPNDLTPAIHQWAAAEVSGEAGVGIEYGGEGTVAGTGFVADVPVRRG